MYVTLILIFFLIILFIYFFVMTTEKEHFKSKGGTKGNKVPKCACVFDIEGTLTNSSHGSIKETAIDARASVESCINAGCAIGLITEGDHCTKEDPDKCKITEYALGFNILDPKQIKSASKKMKKPIITGEKWVVNNIHRGDAMKIFSKKIQNPQCGILIDDNILQSCGRCNTFDKNSYCPAPWGSETETPDTKAIKTSYNCKFNSIHSKDSGEDYMWIPAREIDAKKQSFKANISQMGGTGFMWNDGAQLSYSDGINKTHWNSALKSPAVGEFNQRCKILLKPIESPTLNSKLSKIKKCEYSTNPPKCKTYKDCEKYMQTHCENKIISDYKYKCLPNKKLKTRVCSITSR